MKRSDIILIICITIFIVSIFLFLKKYDQYENIDNVYKEERLNHELGLKQKRIDSLECEIESLRLFFENNPKEKIIKQITVKYEKERSHILSADDDEQLDILSRNLSSKENN